MSTIFTSINTKFDPNSNIGVIRNEFDNVIDKSIYDDPTCYETLTKKMREIMSDKTKTYVNISSDRAISASTLSALNKYVDEKYTIIYIDSSPDLYMNNYDEKMTNKEYRMSVVSNLLSLYNKRYDMKDVSNPKRSYTKHQIDYELNQFIFLGTRDITDYEESIILNNGGQIYSYDKIKKNLDMILDIIIEENKDNNVAIIFDLTSCSMNITPLIILDDNMKNSIPRGGFDLDQLNLILSKLSKLNKIRMIDITGHYLCVNDTEITFRITVETIIKIYSKLLNLKEYSINIFNENSKFLIYKPLDEIYQLEDDKECGLDGWYLLRNMTFGMREELLHELNDDDVIMMEIPKNMLNKKNDKNDKNDKNEIFDEDIQILIACTNMKEQEDKSYYTITSYTDMVLYPNEKISMLFELTNLI
jgi:arginase family enzyme